MTTYSFKSLPQDIDIDRILNEVDDECILIESGNDKYALISEYYYDNCKGINSRFKFNKLYKDGLMYNKHICNQDKIPNTENVMMWHCFDSESSYNLFKGSIKQWMLLEDARYKKPVKTKVIPIKLKNNRTPPSKPKKKKTKLKDYLATLDVNSDKYKELCTKYVLTLTTSAKC